MITHSITEGNDIIAKYMGLKKIKELETINDDNVHLAECFFLPETELVFYPADVLKYHKDWNWQIPVWSKILKETEHINSDILNGYNKSIHNNDINSSYNLLITYLKNNF